MDTTKEYIEMCEAATEIQDFFSDTDNRIGIPVWFYQYAGKCITWEVCKRVGLAYDEDYPSMLTKIVWLPSQDQLQDLLTGYSTVALKLNNFYKFVFYPSPEVLFKKYPPFWIKTFEQLWLAFVMLDKYNKRWVDGKWEKI